MSNESKVVEALRDLENRIVQRLSWLREGSPIDMDAFTADIETLLQAHAAEAAQAAEPVAWIEEDELLRLQREPGFFAEVGQRSFTTDVPLYTHPQPAQPETVEMSPEFTDSARAAIAWVLWHHQGGNSPTGQPLRFALGMGAHERLPEWRINEAKRWAEWAHATTADFHKYESAQPAQDAEAKDSARLNWLDRVGFTTCNEHGREPSNVHSWRDGTALKWTAHWVGSEYPTARAAIDAAMAREAGE